MIGSARAQPAVGAVFRYYRAMAQPYKLYYWPSIQGRGEMVRLVLEEAALPYVDVCRKDGIEPMRELLASRDVFAPPLLETPDGVVMSQMPNICRYLGEKHGLAPEQESERFRAAQLMLTVCDVCDEAHDTHHPLSVAMYYEEQKDAAMVRARWFTTPRMADWLSFFDRVIGDDDYLMSNTLCYADLALFQLVEGLRYAFPKACQAALAQAPRVRDLAERVRQRPAIAAYLASERRLPFNQDGLFRHYPELDL